MGGTGRDRGARVLTRVLEIWATSTRDGNFNRADLRYGPTAGRSDPATGTCPTARGLSRPSTTRGRPSNRQTNNFFGTSSPASALPNLATSAADVRRIGRPSPAGPRSGDRRRIDAQDVAYIRPSHRQRLITDGHANWNRHQEAVAVDSAWRISRATWWWTRRHGAIHTILGTACYPNLRRFQNCCLGAQRAGLSLLPPPVSTRTTPTPTATTPPPDGPQRARFA